MVDKIDNKKVIKEENNDELIIEKIKVDEENKKKSSTTEKKKRKRRIITKESVKEDFEKLEESILEEIENIRDSREKTKGVKFLRTVNKLLKILHKDYLKVLKIKTKKSGNGANSGFNKPTGITQLLADFTGWDVNKKYSRIETTRFLCKYIADNKLQNPKDRRQIIPDEKLSKVLGYDPEISKEPMTYFRLQTYIQPVFIKE